MEEFLTEEVLDIYDGVIVSVFSIRIPDIAQRILLIKKPYCLKSSFDGLNLLLNPAPIINCLQNDGLKSFSDDGKINISNPIILSNSINFINGMFIAFMWNKLIVTEKYRDENVANDPVVQFLRQIRNYFAHGGNFNFDPKSFKESKWRNKKIMLKMQGLKMTKDFMMPGDYLLLLIDINNKFYKPVNTSKK